MTDPARDLELADIERDIGLRGTLYDFVEMAWPTLSPRPFANGWHIGVISEALDAVRMKQIKKLSVNIPPGCMKSTLTSVLWPVHYWIRDPAMAFFGTSFDGELTMRDSRKSLDIIQSDWFIDRWGDIVSVAKWAAVGFHRNSAGGWRFATSVEGKTTGHHPDVKVIDDPTKPKTVSPRTLEETKSWYNNTMRSRGVHGATVLIMQRLAVGDLAGVMHEEGDVHELVLPMRHDPVRASYAKDPRTAKGELLWPERFGEAEVRELEKMPLRDRAAQLDQQPVPDGGAIIKKEWIQRYLPGTEPRRFPIRVLSWDLTFKDAEGSDYVAGQAWGYDPPNFYFLEGILERLDFVASLTAITEMLGRRPGSVVLIEDKANGPAVMSVLSKSVTGIVPVEPLGGKAARLNAASALFEAKNVWLPEGNDVADKLAASLVAFPANAWDDDVDACTQALNYLHEGTMDYEGAMRGLPGGF